MSTIEGDEAQAGMQRTAAPDAQGADGGSASAAQVQARLLRGIEELPGVSRLVPGFRELLTCPDRALHALRGRSQATGVDVVVRATGVRVYVDCCTDGSRPASEVVEEVCQVVAASFEDPPDVQVRILTIDRPDASSP